MPTHAFPRVDRIRNLAAKEPGRPQRRIGRLTIAVVMGAAFSAILTAVLTQTVFSHLSVNNDESVYLLQARAIASGHLFPAAPAPATSFTPWLGVIHGDHYVLKYVPVVALFLAASLVLTGGYVAALMFWSAALVGATFLLTKEVTGNRVTAAIAAALLALSPVVLLQSALMLPYLPFLVLGELSLWGLFAGRRRGSIWALSVAGLCGGLAFAARPFDTLLFLLPPLALALRRPAGLGLRSLGVILAGASLPAAGLLWYDYVATGSALRLPFSLFQPGDTLGFGVHRLYPGETPRHFGLQQGWQGLARHLSLLGGGWVFGGLLLLALAIFGWIRGASRECRAILAGGLLLTFGYLFFWGIWNAAIVWGAVRYLGPYYLLPLLVPLSILGAVGLRELAIGSRWRSGAITLLAAGVSAVTFGPAVSANSRLNADNGQLTTSVSNLGKSLIFVDTYPNYLQHPTAVISNNYPAGGKSVYALERGRDDFAVMQAFPHRPLYRLRLLGEYGKKPHAGFGARLQRVQLRTASTLSFHFTTRLPATAITARLLVQIGSRRIGWALAPRPLDDSQLHLTAPGPDADIGRTHELSSVDPGAGGVLSVSLLARGPSGREKILDRIKLPLVLTPTGELSSLVPVGAPTKLGPAPEPGLTLG